MKRLLTILGVVPWVLMLVLVACSGQSANGESTGAPPPNVEIHTSNDPGELTDDEFDEIVMFTSDRPLGMPCIIWKDRRESSSNAQYAYSGLTCDWDLR